MRELKATDKITQKMTRDGAVSENLATGEVEHISSREPETELSASSEESAGAAADLALRAAEHHEKKSARKAEKADTQAVRDGSAARQRPSSRLQFTEEERADPALGKYIDRSDRAADKLDAAKAAIPTKKVLRTERIFDETAGKGKTQLHFEEVEKRPNGRLRHNPLSRPVHEIAHAAHAKVHEVEQENVGVEAGHKGEVLTERGLAYGKGKVRAAVHHHRTKPWRDAAKAEQASFKANADYLYQKALHDDPALAASNPVSRFLQKQRIKRNHAKELRQAEKTAKNTAATAKSAAQKAKDAFKETFLYIKHHSRAVLLVIGIGACVALLFGGISSCSMMAGSGVGGVFTSSYLSEDTDMLAAEAAYCELEQELQYELDHYEALHPGYDEYRFDLDEIEHDPYVLISILTAFHEGVFTIDEVQAELQMLFEKQYILTQTVEVEVRYRTETRTDSEGNDYDVEVPYNYYICKVKLENFDLSHVPVYIMDEETLSLYAVYMATLGNREDLFPGSGYVDKYTKPPTTYDNLEGESYSIGNQKKLLTKLAKEKGYTNLVHFLDDGISGVTMDRPGFVEMIRQLEEGRAAAVFVKDLSRLGRNYIEVGRLTEEFFPEHDIRLVAVSDNIDTAEGENELAPIRNLFNEWYARDISKKRRISNKIKGNAGEPMGQPPYGYIKDPDNSKRWIVDDEAAQVVRRIYGMTLDGLGTEQIAAQLELEGILTPRAYWLQKGIKRPGKGKQQPPTKWNSSTITKILSLQEYCGDILNFKTYSKSYKNKKRIENDRENWVIFKNVHESIIDRAVWEQVQQKRGKIRKRRTNDGERNMFSGLLVCADCGNNLHFHFNQGNPDIKYFNCSNYKGNRGTCTSTHYVRVDFLEQVVLGEIKRLTRFASHYEDDFVKAVMGSTLESVELDRRLKQKDLASLQARDEELDGLFERIYEDNVSGKLSDDRFAKMSRRYEQEQKELAEKIKALRSEMDKLGNKAMTSDMFISTVRKYTRAKKLTPRMMNELIDRIEVHQAEKINGKWEQRLIIHYNCVGAIFIPDVFPLPAPQVSVNTRKGVVVNYAPCQIAI